MNRLNSMAIQAVLFSLLFTSCNNKTTTAEGEIDSLEQELVIAMEQMKSYDGEEEVPGEGIDQEVESTTTYDLETARQQFVKYTDGSFTTDSKYITDGDGMQGMEFLVYSKNNLLVAERRETAGAYLNETYTCFLFNENLIRVHHHRISRDLLSEEMSIDEFERIVEIDQNSGEIQKVEEREKQTPLGDGVDISNIEAYDTGFGNMPFSSLDVGEVMIEDLAMACESILYTYGSFGTINEIYGNGVVIIDCGKADEMKFYLSPEDEEPERTVGLENGNFTGDYEGINSIVSSPEYDLLHFKIINENKEAGMVQVVFFEEGPDYGEYLWLSTSTKGFSRQSPEEYIKSYTMFSIFEMVNPVRSVPEPLAEIVGRESSVTIIEFDGDWAKVVYDSCGGDEDFGTGWIRWKNGDLILVGIGYIC